jgi:hypothetical protein
MILVKYKKYMEFIMFYNNAVNNLLPSQGAQTENDPFQNLLAQFKPSIISFNSDVSSKIKNNVLKLLPSEHSLSLRNWVEGLYSTVQLDESIAKEWLNEIVTMLPEIGVQNGIVLLGNGWKLASEAKNPAVAQHFKSALQSLIKQNPNFDLTSANYKNLAFDLRDVSATFMEDLDKNPLQTGLPHSWIRSHSTNLKIACLVLGIIGLGCGLIFTQNPLTAMSKEVPKNEQPEGPKEHTDVPKEPTPQKEEINSTPKIEPNSKPPLGMCPLQGVINSANTPADMSVEADKNTTSEGNTKRIQGADYQKIKEIFLYHAVSSIPIVPISIIISEGLYRYNVFEGITKSRIKATSGITIWALTFSNIGQIWMRYKKDSKDLTVAPRDFQNKIKIT